MNPQVLHLIHSLSRGGASRAMIALAKYSARTSAFRHCAVSLTPAAPPMLGQAHDVGLTVLDAPDLDALHDALNRADIVLVHFWNTPELYELLRADLPPLRLLLWFHIAGDQPPQIITRQLIDVTDRAVATSPYSILLPVFQNLSVDVESYKTGMIQGGADFDRVSGIPPVPHAAFNVGYIGTVDFVKLHPQFVPMSVQVNIPNVQFIVCGSGNGFAALQRQARELGAEAQFDFRGFVENVGSMIRQLDVFGYPLCAENYSTGELVLQEVMYAGVPPVVLPYGGAARLVIHNQTGLIAQNEAEYPRALEYLCQYPKERARLGRNAREYAERNFGAERSARQMNELFERMIKQPKREHKWDSPNEVKINSGAEYFVESLGDNAPQFRVSLTSQAEAEVLEAERQIALSSPALSSADSGGILHYRRQYPNDAYLRLWSGLVLQQQGHSALAAGEFSQAMALGLHHRRISTYLARITEKGDMRAD